MQNVTNPHACHVVAWNYIISKATSFLDHSKYIRTWRFAACARSGYLAPNTTRCPMRWCNRRVSLVSELLVVFWWCCSVETTSLFSSWLELSLSTFSSVFPPDSSFGIVSGSIMIFLSDVSSSPCTIDGGKPLFCKCTCICVCCCANNCCRTICC